MNDPFAQQPLVYSFGQGHADGSSAMKDILGGKGAGLAEMTNLGIAVPPGFTITTEVCTHYYANKRTYPKDLQPQMQAGVANMEKIMGTKFGDNNAIGTQYGLGRRRYRRGECES